MNGPENVVGWNSDIESNGQALLRIVAILLGFAMLAESLGSHPAPVRRLVLAILRSAESVAREFIASEIRGQFTHFPAADASRPGAAVREMSKLSPYFTGRFSDDPAEATRLAQSFRALATALNVLCSIIVYTGRRPADGDIEDDAGFACHQPPRRVSGHARPCPDTS